MDESPRGGVYRREADQREADRRLGAEITQRRADEFRPTDGRGAAPSFDREPYPSVYAPPYRVNLKRALRAYVLGHDRGIEAERKLELAERGEDAPDRAERFRGPPESGEVDVESLPRASSGHPEAMEEDAPESLMHQARFGVPIPDRFSFHRGPDVWRDRVRDRAGAAPRERVFHREASRAEGLPPPEDAPRLEATPAEREAATGRDRGTGRDDEARSERREETSAEASASASAERREG